MTTPTTDTDRGRGGLYEFEAIGDTLPYVPLAARRVFDALGKKLSLAGWLSLGVDQRWKVVLAGREERVSPEAADLFAHAVPKPVDIAVAAEPDPDSVPEDLRRLLGTSRPLDAAQWTALKPLDRYVLVKSAPKAEKLERAYVAIVTVAAAASASLGIGARVGPGPTLSHLRGDGAAHMVDVGAKPKTQRVAIASARVRTTPDVLRAILAGNVPKGDVLAVARVAGLMAAKRTPDLVPLCHPVQTTRAAVEFESQTHEGTLLVRVTIEAVDRTGVEMEAMVAASVAALTVYDMIKSADRWALIERVQLDEKWGGKSGTVTRPAEAPGGDPRA